MLPETAGLLVIVPSRGRPASVDRVTAAWRNTGGYEHGTLVFAIDADDPEHGEYFKRALPAAGTTQVEFVTMPKWQPMVWKLNECALSAALSLPGWDAIAFMGDDHLPRTKGWAQALLSALTELETGIVYGRDGFQDARLPTWWAMTPDIVRCLGRMVPAPVGHLFCDNAVKDLGEAAGCLRYLPDVMIEHMHPIAGKADLDSGYARVNAQGQYVHDRAVYAGWRAMHMNGQAERIRELRS